MGREGPLRTGYQASDLRHWGEADDPIGQSPSKCSICGDLADCFQAAFEPTIPAVTAAQTQAVGVTPASGKYIARGKTDATPQRLVEQRAGVDPGGKLDPKNKAARGATDPRSVGKPAFDRTGHTVDILGEGASDTPQMVVVGPVSQEI